MELPEKRLICIEKVDTNVKCTLFRNFHDIRILYLNVLEDECIAVFISNEIWISSFSLITNAIFASRLYVHQLISSALEIFGVSQVNFPIYLYFLRNLRLI